MQATMTHFLPHLSDMCPYHKNWALPRVVSPAQTDAAQLTEHFHSSPFPSGGNFTQERFAQGRVYILSFFTLCELLLLSEYNMEALQIAILWINPFSWKICFSIDLFNPLHFYATWMLSLAKYLYSKHSMYGWLLGLPARQDRGWFPVLHLAQP